MTEYQKNKSSVKPFAVFGYDPDSDVQYLYYPVSFTYRLSSGGELSREYSSIRETDALNSLLAQLAECEEFRPVAFHLEQLKSNTFTEVNINLYNAGAIGLDSPSSSDPSESYSTGYWDMTLTSPQDLAELKAALEADILESELLLNSIRLSAPLAMDKNGYSDSVGSIIWRGDGLFSNLSFELFPDFTHTIAFLESHKSLASAGRLCLSAQPLCFLLFASGKPSCYNSGRNTVFF